MIWFWVIHTIISYAPIPKFDLNMAVNFPGWTLLPGISKHDSFVLSASSTSWTPLADVVVGFSKSVICVRISKIDDKTVDRCMLLKQILSRSLNCVGYCRSLFGVFNDLHMFRCRDVQATL